MESHHSKNSRLWRLLHNIYILKFSMHNLARFYTQSAIILDMSVDWGAMEKFLIFSVSDPFNLSLWIKQGQTKIQMNFIDYIVLSIYCFVLGFSFSFPLLDTTVSFPSYSVFIFETGIEKGRYFLVLFWILDVLVIWVIEFLSAVFLFCRFFTRFGLVKVSFVGYFRFCCSV